MISGIEGTICFVTEIATIVGCDTIAEIAFISYHFFDEGIKAPYLGRVCWHRFYKDGVLVKKYVVSRVWNRGILLLT